MRLGRRGFFWALPLVALAKSPSVATAVAAEGATVWTFDRLDRIGGFPATVLGHPRVIETPLGKAVAFNGIDDAIFIDNHPLAGAGTFTFEVLVRPDPGGAPEQRWFHLSTRDPRTGEDSRTRIMFEIRVIDDRWCLEALVSTEKGYLPLIDRSLLHPLGVWHHVAMVYDGRDLRAYVDGVLEQQGTVAFEPVGPGHSSVGTRINRRSYFKGAVRQARFTRSALAPADFLQR